MIMSIAWRQHYPPFRGNLESTRSTDYYYKHTFLVVSRVSVCGTGVVLLSRLYANKWSLCGVAAASLKCAGHAPRPAPLPAALWLIRHTIMTMVFNYERKRRIAECTYLVGLAAGSRMIIKIMIIGIDFLIRFCLWVN